MYISSTQRRKGAKVTKTFLPQINEDDADRKNKNLRDLRDLRQILVVSY